MNKPDARRLLLVHAHPDDESIGTGATMAKYAAEGAQVTLVTCTLGELGEVIPPELAHLAWDCRRRPRPAPDRRAGRGLRGARRDRSPVPRRRRPVARLGHDGHAVQRLAWLLLAGRRRRGGARAAGRHHRGPAAGHGDLRRQRLLRPSRSHPGASGRLARFRAGRRPGQQVLRDGDSEVGAGRGDGAPATTSAGRRVRRRHARRHRLHQGRVRGRRCRSGPTTTR